MAKRKYLRGDVFLADLSPVCGSEQGGIRPVIIIQNNTGNKHAPTLIIAPVTAKAHKKSLLPTHFLIAENPAFRKPSVVLLEQIRTIDKQRLRKYLGSVTQSEMDGIDHAILTSLALPHQAIEGGAL